MVSGYQDEPIPKKLFRVANIPAHDPAKQRDQKRMDFRTRSPRAAALAVIKHQVNQLIDQVLGLLPVCKVRDKLAIREGNLFLSCSIHLALPDWH